MNHHKLYSSIWCVVANRVCVYLSVSLRGRLHFLRHVAVRSAVFGQISWINRVTVVCRVKEECIKGIGRLGVSFATRRRVFAGDLLLALLLSTRQEGMRLGSNVRCLAVVGGFAQHDVNRVVSVDKLGSMAAHGVWKRERGGGNKSLVVVGRVFAFHLGRWRDCENVEMAT